MRKVLSPVLLCSLLALGCNDAHQGNEDAGSDVDSAVMCDPCEDAIQLRIQGEPAILDPADIVIEGVDLVCMDASPFIYCGIRDYPPGEYSLTISAPGYASQMIFFSIGEPTTIRGCTCPSTFSQLVTLRQDM